MEKPTDSIDQESSGYRRELKGILHSLDLCRDELEDRVRPCLLIALAYFCSGVNILPFKPIIIGESFVENSFLGGVCDQ